MVVVGGCRLWKVGRKADVSGEEMDMCNQARPGVRVKALQERLVIKVGKVLWLKDL